MMMQRAASAARRATRPLAGAAIRRAATLASLARPTVTAFKAADFPSASWSLKEYNVVGDTASSSPPSITRGELVHLSSLSYLPYPTDDAALVRDVSSVVRWFESITSLDLKGVEPMYTPLEVAEYFRAGSPSGDAPTEAPGIQLRPDVVADGGIEKQLLGNAPYHHRGFFVVPKSGKLTDMEDS